MPVEFGHKAFLADSAQGLITDYPVLDGNPADTLGNAYFADAGLLTVLLIFGTVKAPIARVQLGTMLEDLSMTVERSLHLLRSSASRSAVFCPPLCELESTPGRA